jgi:hypothetical protein
MKKGIDSLITWSNKLIDSKMNYRLPDNLKPSLYQLEIQPFILDKPFTFKGKCNITFNCVQPTNEIIFHSHQLYIDENKLEISSLNDSSIRLNIHTIVYDVKRNFVIIKTNQNCLKNIDYTIMIVYTGLLSYKLNGFYISSYIDKKANLE